jgi:hypothetical protein
MVGPDPFSSFGKSSSLSHFPSRHGRTPEDALDLIIPSLPGYGPSGKPKTPIGARTTARLFDKLMRKNLGYDSYYAQGGTGAPA